MNWLLAQRLHSNMGALTPGTFGNPILSRRILEDLGFRIVKADVCMDSNPGFYEVEPPEGWTMETQDSWTVIRDATGYIRMSQTVLKLPPYSFLNVY